MSINPWIVRQMWYMYTVEYLFSHQKKWNTDTSNDNVEYIMISEINQSQEIT